MHEYQVGQPFIPGKTSWGELGEYHYCGGAHELRLFLMGVTPTELRSIEEGTARFGLFVDSDLLMLLYRFGDMRWADAPYTFHMLPPDEQVLPELLADAERVLLLIVLVDAGTGIVLARRALNLDHNFSQRLIQEIRSQASQPFDLAAYNAHLAHICRIYSSKELYSKAVARCHGED